MNVGAGTNEGVGVVAGTSTKVPDHEAHADRGDEEVEGRGAPLEEGLEDELVRGEGDGYKFRPAM